jgi:hypothetical protein
MSDPTSLVINAVTFQPARDFKYTKPKINKSGGKSVSILNAHTSKSLYLSAPLMLTWGVSEFVDEKSGKRTFDMALQFPQADFRSEATDKFLQNMLDFQQKIKADAIVNSKDWLNKPRLTEEVVDALFHPMLKYAKDPSTGEPDLTKSPTLKVKVDFWDNNFTCEIYDSANKMLFPVERSSSTPVDLITKASNVAVIIQCGGLWFANGKFGVTWKLFQAMVQPKTSMRGKCLISLSSEDKSSMGEKRKAPIDAQEDEFSSGTKTMQIVEDSDEEEEEPTATPRPTSTPAAPNVVAMEEDGADEDGESETPTPTPTPQQIAAAALLAPAAVKKVVRKVKA